MLQKKPEIQHAYQAQDYINCDIDEDLEEEDEVPKRKDAQNEVIDSEIKDSMIVTQTDSIRGLNS